MCRVSENEFPVWEETKIYVKFVKFIYINTTIISIRFIDSRRKLHYFCVKKKKEKKKLYILELLYANGWNFRYL